VALADPPAIAAAAKTPARATAKPPEATRLLAGYWSTRNMTTYPPTCAQIHRFLRLRGGNDAVAEVEEFVLEDRNSRQRGRSSVQLGD
jgi:hypothetical protein